MCWGALERTGSSLPPETAPGKGSCSWCGAELGRRDEEDGGVHWGGFLCDTPPPRSAVQPCIAAGGSRPLCQRLLRLLPPPPGDLLGKAGGLAFSQGPPQEAGKGVQGQRGCALSQPGGPRVGVPGVGLLLSVPQLVEVGGG